LFALFPPSPNLPLSARRDTAVIATTAAAVGASAAYLLFHNLKGSRPKGSSKPVESNEGDRRYLVAGNWKCNGTVEENEALIKVFNDAGAIPSNVDVAICGSFVHLPQLLATLREDIAVGGQDCGNNAKGGAYTGQVSAAQLKDLGCEWVIVGHSERREGFGMPGEPVELCAQKAKVAIDAGLKVMFCIGEKQQERESGQTMAVCAKQLAPLLSTLDASSSDWNSVAIAYEPVWAIGTGLTATPEMAQETHADIRKWLSDNVSPAVAKATRIQYGGSMKGANAKELLAQPDIDGGLIGGASLTEDFFNIVNAVPM
jgi:triosephosphate isomerase